MTSPVFFVLTTIQTTVFNTITTAVNGTTNDRTIAVGRHVLRYNEHHPLDEEKSEIKLIIEAGEEVGLVDTDDLFFELTGKVEFEEASI